MDWLLDCFEFRIVGQYLDVFAQRILQALWISLICLVMSLIFGVGLALARMSKRQLIWRNAAGYIQFIRSTPLLIRIYLESACNITFGIGKAGYFSLCDECLHNFYSFWWCQGKTC